MVELIEDVQQIWKNQDLHFLMFGREVAERIWGNQTQYGAEMRPS